MSKHQARARGSERRAASVSACSLEALRLSSSCKTRQSVKFRDCKLYRLQCSVSVNYETGDCNRITEHPYSRHHRVMHPSARSQKAALLPCGTNEYCPIKYSFTSVWPLLRPLCAFSAVHNVSWSIPLFLTTKNGRWLHSVLEMSIR